MSRPMIFTSGPGPITGPGTVGTILDRVWRIFDGQIRLFVLLGTVPAGTMLLSYALIFGGLYAAGVIPPHPGPSFSPDKFVLSIYPAMLAGMIPMVAAYALMEAAVCHSALAANRGAGSSFREAYTVAWKNAGRFVWLMVLRWIAIAAPALLLWGAIGGLVLLRVGPHGVPSPESMLVLFPVLLLLYVGMGVYFVWVTLRLGLAVPASLAEAVPASLALRRSWQLTRIGLGRIFLVLLVVAAIGYAVVMVLELAAFAVGALGIAIAGLIHVKPALGIGLGVTWACLFFLGMFLLSATIWAAYAVGFTVIYDDQRQRLELLVQGEPA